METTRIDGREIAAEILEEVRLSLPEGIRPVVRAIVVSPTPATRSYLRIKAKAAQEAGMVLEVIELAATVSDEEVIAAVTDAIGAVIVQLPLPEHLDEARILASIPVASDADILSPKARAGTLTSPVAGAVSEVLARTSVSVEGKSVVVVGNGYLVGQPVAEMLEDQGALVTVLDIDTFEDGREQLVAADIVVSGTGSPHLIRPEMVKEGVVLIDAGTSELGGKLAGDIDPACAEKASVFTPTPGGIGPVAVACLYRNVSRLKP